MLCTRPARGTNPRAESGGCPKKGARLLVEVGGGIAPRLPTPPPGEHLREPRGEREDETDGEGDEEDLVCDVRQPAVARVQHELPEDAGEDERTRNRVRDLDELLGVEVDAGCEDATDNESSKKDVRQIKREVVLHDFLLL